VDRAIAYLYNALETVLRKDVPARPSVGAVVSGVLSDIAWDEPSDAMDPIVLDVAVSTFKKMHGTPSA
jgi:hypothetical protein